MSLVTTSFAARQNLLIVPFILLAALGLGHAAVSAPNEVIVLGALLLVLGVFRVTTVAGVTVWCVWLLTPLVRRLLVQTLGSPGQYDPASLFPFIATVVCALPLLSRFFQDRQAKRFLSLVGLGLVIGLPVGFVRSPTAAFYGSLTYLSALLGIAIGHSEGIDGEGHSTLSSTLKWFPPVLALYGIYQYAIGLPRWDLLWAETSGLGSLKIIGETHYRPWSTLNSPGTFAVILALSILLWLGSAKLGPIQIVLVISLIAALAVTYVRAAWLGMIVGLLAIYLSNRRASTHVLVLVLVATGLAFSVGSRFPVVDSVLGRASSLGELQSDNSVKARVSLLHTVVPDALLYPIGHGIGQAGVAARLGESQDLASADNGFVAILYQFGPLGFVMIVGAQLYIVTLCYQLTKSGAIQQSSIPGAFGILVALLTMQFFGDALYGIGGVIFWWISGFVLALAARNSATLSADKLRNRHKIRYHALRLTVPSR